MIILIQNLLILHSFLDKTFQKLFHLHPTSQTKSWMASNGLRRDGGCQWNFRSHLGHLTCLLYGICLLFFFLNGGCLTVLFKELPQKYLQKWDSNDSWNVHLFIWVEYYCYCDNYCCVLLSFIDFSVDFLHQGNFWMFFDPLVSASFFLNTGRFSGGCIVNSPWDASLNPPPRMLKHGNIPF